MRLFRLVSLAEAESKKPTVELAELDEGNMVLDVSEGEAAEVATIEGSVMDPRGEVMAAMVFARLWERNN
jgi:protocatechuate 3,4-dioxygenase beta subunit